MALAFEASLRSFESQQVVRLTSVRQSLVSGPIRAAFFTRGFQGLSRFCSRAVNSSLPFFENRRPKSRKKGALPYVATIPDVYDIRGLVDLDDDLLLPFEACPDGSVMFRFGEQLESSGGDLAGSFLGFNQEPVPDLNGEVDSGCEDRGGGADQDGFLRVATSTNSSASQVAGAMVQQAVTVPVESASCGAESVGGESSGPGLREGITFRTGLVNGEGRTLGTQAHDGLPVAPSPLPVRGTAIYEVCEPAAEENTSPKCHLRMESGMHMIPHPAKLMRGGEDAFFIEGNWVGVADGDSARWAELGVNSGMYARELMWNCASLVQGGELEMGLDPQAVIEESHSRSDMRGSCTATVAVLDGQILRVANIGDSGFRVLRGGVVVARSDSMKDSFNEPVVIGNEGLNDPVEAQVYNVEVQGGDILLLATDGLYDNVFEDQIIATLTQARDEGKSPEASAKKLAPLAQRNGAMTKGDTPFCQDAKACGHNIEGGKQDDVTVIVTYIF